MSTLSFNFFADDRFLRIFALLNFAVYIISGIARLTGPGALISYRSVNVSSFLPIFFTPQTKKFSLSGAVCISVGGKASIYSTYSLM